MAHDDYFQKREYLPLGTQLDLAEVVAHLQFNSDGLIPVITQRQSSGEVLMMAWMNRAALAITLQEGFVCYWSRSRQTLWRKGETSGHRQQLKALRIDCDGDCILCWVEQIGPACHTGRSNCFYWGVQGDKVELLSAPLDSHK